MNDALLFHKIETLDECLGDIQSLVAANHEETGLYPDLLDIDPDYDAYRLAEAAGSLKIRMTRTEEYEPVGYLVGILSKHHQYKTKTMVQIDTLYLEPEFRHGLHAQHMIALFEEKMKDLGVDLIFYHMKTYKTFEALMDFLEYDKLEYVYSKYLGNKNG